MFSLLLLYTKSINEEPETSARSQRKLSLLELSHSNLNLDTSLWSHFDSIITISTDKVQEEGVC